MIPSGRQKSWEIAVQFSGTDAEWIMFSLLFNIYVEFLRRFVQWKGINTLITSISISSCNIHARQLLDLKVTYQFFQEKKVYEHSSIGKKNAFRAVSQVFGTQVHKRNLQGMGKWRMYTCFWIKWKHCWQSMFSKELELLF